MTTLRSDGLEFFRGAFVGCIDTIAKFQRDVEACLKAPMTSGYILATWKGDRVKKAVLRSVDPEFGPTRLQSKSHPLPLPGSEALWNRARELNLNLSLQRMTLEWMSPAPLNANGWHIDTPDPMYKLAILLDDIDPNTCPMSFAFGGGSALERARAHLRATGFKATKEGRTGPHWAAHVGGHVGYLRDDQADNTGCLAETTVIDREPCRVALRVGKAGDAYAFDVSMFHCSNNLKGSKVRRIVVLS